MVCCANAEASDGKFTFVQKGTQTPFTGTLFDPTATAKIMANRIKNESSVKKLQIIRLTQTKYRLLIGPFDDIKSLKDSFEKLNSFNFENLEILKND